MSALWALFSLLLLFGFAPVPSLAVMLICYLSLSVAGQTFLSFQWDTLLLETGFLAIFFAPPGWLPWPAGTDASFRLFEYWLSVPAGRVSGIVLLLFWWLLFRLMFESGIVKLSFGDRNWRNLAALDYHYFTQPLPTFVGWYFHQCPAWFRKASVLAVYVNEIALPLLIFGPRECRYLACAGIVFLMLVILLTGNYCFFNLLAIALAMLLLDDSVWRHILPQALIPAGVPDPPAIEPGWPRLFLAAFVLLEQFTIGCIVAHSWHGHLARVHGLEGHATRPQLFVKCSNLRPAACACLLSGGQAPQGFVLACAAV